jgi:hypothetical protein
MRRKDVVWPVVAQRRPPSCKGMVAAAEHSRRDAHCRDPPLNCAYQPIASIGSDWIRDVLRLTAQGTNCRVSIAGEQRLPAAQRVPFQACVRSSAIGARIRTSEADPVCGRGVRVGMGTPRSLPDASPGQSTRWTREQVRTTCARAHRRHHPAGRRGIPRDARCRPRKRSRRRRCRSTPCSAPRRSACARDRGRHTAQGYAPARPHLRSRNAAIPVNRRNTRHRCGMAKRHRPRRGPSAFDP